MWKSWRGSRAPDSPEQVEYAGDPDASGQQCSRQCAPGARRHRPVQLPTMQGLAKPCGSLRAVQRTLGCLLGLQPGRARQHESETPFSLRSLHTLGVSVLIKTVGDMGASDF